MSWHATPARLFPPGNKKFPRSFFHALLEVKSRLRHLPRHHEVVAMLNDIGKKVLRADQAILKQDELHSFIDGLQPGAAELHREITRGDSTNILSPRVAKIY